MLKINDKPGARTVAEMRALFEKGVCDTGGIYAREFANLTWDEKTEGYANENTHRHWVGFAIGMRTAQREADAKIPQGLALIRQMVAALNSIMESKAIDGEAYQEQYSAAALALTEAHRIFPLPMLTPPLLPACPTCRDTGLEGEFPCSVCFPLKPQPAEAEPNYYAGCTLSSETTREACGCRGCLMELEDIQGEPQPAAIDAAGEAICTRGMGSLPESCGCPGCQQELQGRLGWPE